MVELMKSLSFFEHASPSIFRCGQMNVERLEAVSKLKKDPETFDTLTMLEEREKTRIQDLLIKHAEAPAK